MPDDLKTVFNGLSKADRLALKSAAFTKVMSSNMAVKTEEDPWKYPFYAAYITTLATPLPVFGAGVVLGLATSAWIGLGVTEDARSLKGRLSDAFEDERLVRDHMECIAVDEKKAGRFNVKGRQLASSTTKRALSDGKAATKAFRNYLKFPAK